MDKRRRHGPSSGAVRRRVLAGTGLSLGAALGMGATAEAATYTVTSAAGDTSAGSLKDIIASANATTTVDDTIVFSSALSGSTIALVGTQVSISDAVQINGGGTITVRGNGTDRVIATDLGLTGGGAVGISGLTITGGFDPVGVGGGILNQNAALTVTGSVVSGNVAAGDGGGIYNNAGGFLTIVDSTVSGNFTGDDGGGIHSFSGGMSIANSTISGNRTATTGISHYGGGVYAAFGPTTITNSTIASNTALEAGGVYRDAPSAPVVLRNTIVADNTAPSAPNLGFDGNFAGDFAFVESTASTLTSLTPRSNIVGKDPQLGPLGGNGGPTPTQALSKTSPALDQGRSFGFTSDQRGQRRPFNLVAIPNSTAAGADGSDMGAVEQCKKTKKKKGKKGAFAAAKKKPKKAKGCKKKKKKKKKKK